MHSETERSQCFSQPTRLIPIACRRTKLKLATFFFPVHAHAQLLKHDLFSAATTSYSGATWHSQVNNAIFVLGNAHLIFSVCFVGWNDALKATGLDLTQVYTRSVVQQTVMSHQTDLEGEMICC